MLTRMSKSISSFFIKNGSISAEDRNVYDYCFEILLSTILNLVLILLIAIFSKTLSFTTFYIVGFMLVRRTAGGYHADSHWSCVSILLGAYTVYLLLLKSIPTSILNILSFLFIFFAVLLVYTLSPIEDQNKSFSCEETKYFKRKSRLWIVALAVLAIALTALIPHLRFGFSLSAGMLTVALSLIAGKIKNHMLNSKTVVR